MKKSLFSILLCFAAIFLVSCAEKANQNEDGVVQDIQPGDQSVIQAPSAPDQGRSSRIEERDL